MKVVGLDGREVTWKLSGCRVLGDETRPRSGPHLRARVLIASVFSCDQVLEEVPIPGSRLRIDFYVATRSLAVEVNGRQHYERTPHFHKTKHDFRRAVRNDAEKARFCDENGIGLVVLRDEDDEDEWRRLLGQG